MNGYSNILTAYNALTARDVKETQFTVQALQRQDSKDYSTSLCTYL